VSDSTVHAKLTPRWPAGRAARRFGLTVTTSPETVTVGKHFTVTVRVLCDGIAATIHFRWRDRLHAGRPTSFGPAQRQTRPRRVVDAVRHIASPRGRWTVHRLSRWSSAHPYNYPPPSLSVDSPKTRSPAQAQRSAASTFLSCWSAAVVKRIARRISECRGFSPIG